MFKGVPYANKIVKRRDQERNLMNHRQQLRNIRPITSNIEGLVEPMQTVNQRKKAMLQEDRFTEIERENRMLLVKINTIMNKKNTLKVNLKEEKKAEKQRMNKSLHSGFRRKQLEDIEIENAKLLKRLQDRRSDYETRRLNSEWKKQKSVIKNIANYPFILKDKQPPRRRKSTTSNTVYNRDFRAQGGLLSENIQLVRIRNLNGDNFLVTVHYDGQKLHILGDNKATKEIKVIEISKEEAIEFIQYECDGKIEGIFDCLRYDEKEKVLYLVGKGVELQAEAENEEEEEKEKNQKQSPVSAEKKQNAELEAVKDFEARGCHQQDSAPKQKDSNNQEKQNKQQQGDQTGGNHAEQPLTDGGNRVSEFEKAEPDNREETDGQNNTDHETIQQKQKQFGQESEQPNRQKEQPQEAK